MSSSSPKERVPRRLLPPHFLLTSMLFALYFSLEAPLFSQSWRVPWPFFSILARLLCCSVRLFLFSMRRALGPFCSLVLGPSCCALSPGDLPHCSPVIGTKAVQDVWKIGCFDKPLLSHSCYDSLSNVLDVSPEIRCASVVQPFFVATSRVTLQTRSTSKSRSSVGPRFEGKR